MPRPARLNRHGSALLRVAAPPPSASPRGCAAASALRRFLVAPLAGAPRGLAPGSLRSQCRPRRVRHRLGLCSAVPSASALGALCRYALPGVSPPPPPLGERRELRDPVRIRSALHALRLPLDIFRWRRVPCERYKTYPAFCLIAYPSGSALALVSSPAGSAITVKNFFRSLVGSFAAKKIFACQNGLFCIIRGDGGNLGRITPPPSSVTLSFLRGMPGVIMYPCVWPSVRPLPNGRPRFKKRPKEG